MDKMYYIETNNDFGDWSKPLVREIDPTVLAMLMTLRSEYTREAAEVFDALVEDAMPVGTEEFWNIWMDTTFEVPQMIAMLTQNQAWADVTASGAVAFATDKVSGIMEMKEAIALNAYEEAHIELAHW